MGCKLSRMYFKKKKKCCQRVGSRETLLCSVMIFCGSEKCHIVIVWLIVPWEKHCWKKYQRNFSGLGGRGEWKMGCLTTRSSPEAILIRLRSVRAQLFYAGSSLWSIAFILWKHCVQELMYTITAKAKHCSADTSCISTRRFSRYG